MSGIFGLAKESYSSLPATRTYCVSFRHFSASDFLQSSFSAILLFLYFWHISLSALLLFPFAFMLVTVISVSSYSYHWGIRSAAASGSTTGIYSCLCYHFCNHCSAATSSSTASCSGEAYLSHQPCPAAAFAITTYSVFMLQS
jgi:hypothetical protein